MKQAVTNGDVMLLRCTMQMVTIVHRASRPINAQMDTPGLSRKLMADSLAASAYSLISMDTVLRGLYQEAGLDG